MVAGRRAVAHIQVVGHIPVDRMLAAVHKGFDRMLVADLAQLEPAQFQNSGMLWNFLENILPI